MIAAGILALGVLCFAAGLCVLVHAEKHPAPRMEGSAAIVVLGAQVYEDGRLSPQLELRMEAALAEYMRQPRIIITCGGQGEGEPAPEGELMRQWLLEKGVPEDRVYCDGTSMNTMQNLKNARRFLPEGEVGITVITSDYHLPRALQLARDVGYRADGVGSPCKMEYWLQNHLREVLAWGKYGLSRLGLVHYN